MTGGITAANEVIFAPLAGQKVQFNWRILPATAGLALALAGLEQIAPGFAVGLAWLSLGAVLVVPFGNAPTPLENLLTVMGYKKLGGWREAGSVLAGGPHLAGRDLPGDRA
jgi:hypothetical protein